MEPCSSSEKRLTGLKTNKQPESKQTKAENSAVLFASSQSSDDENNEAELCRDQSADRRPSEHVHRFLPSNRRLFTSTGQTTTKPRLKRPNTALKHTHRRNCHASQQLMKLKSVFPASSLRSGRLYCDTWVLGLWMCFRLH